MALLLSSHTPMRVLLGRSLLLKRKSKLRRLRIFRARLARCRKRRRDSSGGSTSLAALGLPAKLPAPAKSRKLRKLTQPTKPRKPGKLRKPTKQLETGPTGTEGKTAEDLRLQLDLRIEHDPYGDCPAPVTSFRQLKPSLPESVLSNLERGGITTPMPIQAQALPLILAGRDVVGLAQTGSGKTLAFLLPLASRMLASKPGKQPRALVLAPTRELAVQIAKEGAIMFGEGSARSLCVYGGGDKGRQRNELARGVDVLAATPGRLLDFLEGGDVRLDKVNYFVLDEADRMLEYGFHDDVTSIMAKASSERQLLFFSATWSPEVQRLASRLCGGREPVRISYGQGKKEQNGTDARPHAREGIIQEVVVVDHDGAEDQWERQEKEKNKILHAHLEKVLGASSEHKVLVFVSRKDLADKVSTQLQKAGFKADAMHGGKSQEYRLWVLEEFRKGALQLLVCTDVLGRGIDIPSVSHIVIHEMGDIDDYVHRIGRTARGKHGSGHALVFFEYWEGAPQIAEELIAVLEASKQPVPQDLRRIAKEVASGKRKIRVVPRKGRK